MRIKKSLVIGWIGCTTLPLLTSNCGQSTPPKDAPPLSELSVERLGELLFFDENLSAHRRQSCATCHDPLAAFVDPRSGPDDKLLATSLGDDGSSLGTRNAPTVAYARHAPSLFNGKRERHNTDGDLAEYAGYLGGLFYDGRAVDLEEQAGGPPLNPAEMGMPDERAVIERIAENPDYVAAFEQHYGSDVWNNPLTAYAAMTSAIAAFERTDIFAAFDSRYDRSLLPSSNENRYTYSPASLAAQGKALFFSAEFTNCAACHQLHPQSSSLARQEVFTGFEYHNLGVPQNHLGPTNNAALDLGLGAHLEEQAEEGKFKTPTLRNVAVTAPYMHNGLFRDLSTVVRFYEHRKRRARGEDDDSVNPESQKPWGAPEVDRNISDRELGSGNKDLSDATHVSAIVCFLVSLTDARYEALLDAELVTRCGL